MEIKVKLNKTMKIRKENVMFMIEQSKGFNNNIYTRLMELIPVWVLDMLNNETVSSKRVDEFVNANRDNLQKIIDKRKVEEVVFNYYTCLITELLGQAFIETLGFPVRRNSIDADVSNNKHTLGVTPDLQVYWNNKWHNVEVQMGMFQYDSIQIKAYKAKENLRKDINVSFFILSYNRELGKIEYITFYLRNYLKKATLLKNYEPMGGKDTYRAELKNFEIKNIA